MDAADPRRPAAAPLATLAVLTAAYVLSQFFRTALAVVAPEIAQDLALAPSELGVLSSAWFWAFAAAQIPVGVALDRWGPRRTVGVVFATAGVGCAVFASASSLAMAALGQALIGIGCAPVFMGTLVVLTRFFEARRFAVLSSTILAVGNGGTLLGTTPMALATEWAGWRGTFLIMGGVVVGLAALALVIVRDAPTSTPRRPRVEETLAATVRGIVAIVRNRRLWAILPISFTGYAALVTVRGLWAGPYLTDLFAMAPLARGQVLLAMSVATILGTLAYGFIEQRLDRRRGPVLVGSLGAVLGLLLLALLPAPSAFTATMLLTAFAALAATYPLIMAQGRRFLSDAEVGRGLTFLNGTCFFGAASIQVASGFVLDVAQATSRSPSTAYSWLFLFLSGLLILALAAYSRSADLRRGDA